MKNPREQGIPLPPSLRHDERISSLNERSQLALSVKMGESLVSSRNIGYNIHSRAVKKMCNIFA